MGVTSTTATPRADGRVQRGERSRANVLQIAADLATTQGLEGLSIAAVAERAGMSKAGVVGLFGSKLQLQLATVRAARETYIELVTGPALAVPGGIDRVIAVADNMLDYSEQRVHTGGCFFAATSAELGSRPGPVRDAVLVAMDEWYGFVEFSVRRAVDRGELAADPEQLAFEICAVLDSANRRSLLTGSVEPYAQARASVRKLLGR
jgi:AcrR family transcriptional regulator